MPYLLEVAVQIMLAVHAARTGRLQPWLWIILFIPGLGSLLYVLIELGPELVSGRTGRKVRTNLVKTVDPGRGYRELARHVEIAPTVHNKMLLADECLRIGRADEAVGLYETCAVGLHATEPGIRMGLARAKFEAGDFTGTLAELDRLAVATPERRSAEGHLLYARALDASGKHPAALEEYRALAAYFPGEEARARWAELLTRTGATEQAREQYREIVRRADLQGGQYRRAQKEWYNEAKRGLA